jgi:membrane protein implicated in regulation of membrane protease activity
MSEYLPGPFMKMSPAGLVGFLIVLVVCFGFATLFGLQWSVVGLALMAIVALLFAVVLRSWRARHVGDSHPLHLGAGPEGDKKNG